MQAGNAFAEEARRDARELGRERRRRDRCGELDEDELLVGETCSSASSSSGSKKNSDSAVSAGSPALSGCVVAASFQGISIGGRGVLLRPFRAPSTRWIEARTRGPVGGTGCPPALPHRAHRSEFDFPESISGLTKLEKIRCKGAWDVPGGLLRIGISRALALVPGANLDLVPPGSRSLGWDVPLG